MSGGTKQMTFERYLITQGSYGGDGPMPGLVHRGIPIPEMPRRHNHEFAFAFPGMAVEDLPPAIPCYQYILQGEAEFYIIEPDSWREIGVFHDHKMEVNPYNRPQLFVAGKKGATSDYYLNVMGESRDEL